MPVVSNSSQAEYNAVGATAVYGASPTKARRTKADIDGIRTTIHDLVAAEQPMTVRQVFYRLVSLGAIAKTEGEYKTTVCRLLGLMRRDKSLPFWWIADNTRWMRKPRTHGSLQQLLAETTRTYRRAVWDNQDVYVEVWLEKDALAGVVYDVTAEWDVPLMVTRGYPSLSYVYDAAEGIADRGKPAHIYYLGDHDPSGVDIPRTVERDLREFAPDAEIHFHRVAVLPWQITAYDLPTRPTKTTDSRSPGFLGESVELDAIPPGDLRNMVRGSIEQHIDDHALGRLQVVERQERETLAAIAAQLNGTAA